MEFLLGDVLTITSEIALCGLDDEKTAGQFDLGRLYQILNFLTRDNLFSHQLSRATKACQPWILRQYPALSSPELQFELGWLKEMLRTETGRCSPEALCRGWLTSLPAATGLPRRLELEPLPGDDWEHLDPLYELERNGLAADQIVPVVIATGDPT
jgi:hypothetical protein